MPPPDVLFPTPVTVVGAVASDAARFDPPVPFENGVELLARRFDTPRVGRGRPLVVTTWWRAAEPVGRRWEIFLHVDGTAPGQARFAGGGAGEHEPGDWSYPTNRWRPGEIVMDRFEVRPFPDVPPGTYEVFAGLWRADTKVRLRVLEASRHDGGDRVPLGSFEQAGAD